MEEVQKEDDILGGRGQREDGVPAEEDNLSEDDRILHECEKDQQHASQQPHLQGRHRVRHRYPRP